MTTTLIILLSAFFGIYLERGRKWYMKRRQAKRMLKQAERFKEEMKASMEKLVTSFVDAIKEMSKEDDKRRQHAAEDQLGRPWPEFKPGGPSPMPFAGGRAVFPWGSNEVAKEPGFVQDQQLSYLQDQLKDALEHEEFERAAVLRDKMRDTDTGT